jgi:hypothetical protein
MLLEQDTIHIKLGKKNPPPPPLAENCNGIAMTELKFLYLHISISLYFKLLVSNLKFMLLKQDAIHIKLGRKRSFSPPLAENSSVLAMTELKSY